jgi:hypothetical protein
MVGAGFSGSECVADDPPGFATKQRPLITEEALPVVDYALVFPPGPLKKTGEVGGLLLFRQTLKLADVFRLRVLCGLIRD